MTVAARSRIARGSTVTGLTARGLIAATLLTAIAMTPAAAQRRTPPPAATPPATATASNGGQAIQIGAITVPRPFGAELVDTLRLAGTFRVGGQRVHLVRGDAGSGACRTRYVFVTEQRGGAPLVSSPFGTCSADARVTPARGGLIVTMSARAGTTGSARYGFDGTNVRALNAAASAVAATAAADAPLCLSAAQLPAAAQAEAVTAFEQAYPFEYRKLSRLRRAQIDQAEMEALVTALACIAPWPVAERRIPKLATPLFASRHGPAAFAALQTVAIDPASDAHLRAVTTSFAAEMRYRVGRREPVLGDL